jgi:hypothetical protein
MDWTEYETVREDVIQIVKAGNTITQVYPVARTHAQLYSHALRIPSCATSFIEMFFEIEREYKNQKGIE